MRYGNSEIARVVHEANRALQIIQWDPAIPVSAPWDDLDEETRQSAINGVEGVLVDGNDPRESHENWMQFKLDAGWIYGEVKDEVAQTHPLLIPYVDLPPEAKIKDDLFVAICQALGTEAEA